MLLLRQIDFKNKAEQNKNIVNVLWQIYCTIDLDVKFWVNLFIILVKQNNYMRCNFPRHCFSKLIMCCLFFVEGYVTYTGHIVCRAISSAVVLRGRIEAFDWSLTESNNYGYVLLTICSCCRRGVQVEKTISY